MTTRVPPNGSRLIPSSNVSPFNNPQQGNPQARNVGQISLPVIKIDRTLLEGPSLQNRVSPEQASIWDSSSSDESEEDRSPNIHGTNLKGSLALRKTLSTGSDSSENNGFFARIKKSSEGLRKVASWDDNQSQESENLFATKSDESLGMKKSLSRTSSWDSRSEESDSGIASPALKGPVFLSPPYAFKTLKKGQKHLISPSENTSGDEKDIRVSQEKIEKVRSRISSIAYLGVRGGNLLGSPFSQENSSEDEIKKKKGSSPLLVGNPTVSKFEKLIHSAPSSDLEASLFGKTKKIVDDGIKALKTLPDSPGRKSKGTSLNQTIRNLFVRIGKTDNFNTFGFHQTAFEKWEASAWVPETAKSLVREFHNCKYPAQAFFPQQIINISHITEGASNKSNVKSVGFHWCPPESPMRELLQEVQLNSQTGVFCGYFKLEEGQEPKFSTFFPDNIRTADELVCLIQNSEEITRSGNRSLRRTSEANSFLIELYLKENGLIVNSAFPIFFAAKISADSAPFAITENFLVTDPKKLIQDTIAFVGKNLLADENKNPVRFIFDHEDGKEVMIDIAPMIEGVTKIPHGIYLQLSMDYFPDIEKD